MLTSLGLGAVSSWVLHHHERWDERAIPAASPARRSPSPQDYRRRRAFDTMISETVEPDAGGGRARASGRDAVRSIVVAALVAELANRNTTCKLPL